MLTILLLFIPVYLFYPTFIRVFSMPFSELESLFPDKHLFVTSVFEGFFTKIKLSILLSVVFALPMLFYHTARFVFPGLTRKEKRLFGFSIFSGAILAVFSFYLVYFQLLPFSLQFLLQHHFIPQDVGIMLHFQQNLFFVFNMLFYSMLAFQLPVIVEVMLYLNLIQRRWLWGVSRYVIIFILILSAIITPPDVISQLSFSIPLICLHFLTLLIAKVFRFGEG